MYEAPSAGPGSEQSRHNADLWSRGTFVGYYAKDDLRPAESVLLERNREQVSGRVLELGSGAGRLTGHLIAISREVHGVDISPAMVAYCQRTYPTGVFSVGDLTDPSAFQASAFDAIFASFCVLDVLDDAQRSAALDGIHGHLVPGGLFVLSSHNHAFAPFNRKPTQILARNPRRVLANVLAVPRRTRNYRRLAPHIREEPGYAVLVDEAHDFSLLHYYIGRDAQELQLNEHGYELIECLALDGTTVARGEDAAHCPELHYVARRGETPS